MSIWCSQQVVGYDERNDDEEPRGDVRSYATGFSNHYPDHEVEVQANISLATIPAWCVPGHFDDPLKDRLGPWLRMHVNTWEHDYYEPTTVKGKLSAGVVLDEQAVRALVEQLREWLDTPKAHPTTSGRVR